MLNPTRLESDDNYRFIEGSDKRPMIDPRVEIVLATE